MQVPLLCGYTGKIGHIRPQSLTETVSPAKFSRDARELRMPATAPANPLRLASPAAPQSEHTRPNANRDAIATASGVTCQIERWNDSSEGCYVVRPADSANYTRGCSSDLETYADVPEDDLSHRLIRLARFAENATVLVALPRLLLLGHVSARL